MVGGDMHGIYDAVYIGNDNDYLERSKMRKLFARHACQEDDVKLFEMPEFPPVDGGALALAGHLDPFRIEMFTPQQMEEAYGEYLGYSFLRKVFCTPRPAAFDKMHPCLQLAHHCKCYLFGAVLLFFMFYLIFSTLMDKEIENSLA